MPAAVWRSMDREMHLTEVGLPGQSLSGHSHSSGMNQAGWQVLVASDRNPATYHPKADLYTADDSAIYGVFVTSKGTRYTSEVNGTRASGWGKGQALDFQETAPFLALRSGKPLAEAVQDGISGALKDPQIARDMSSHVSPEQIVWWMSDLANIALPDFVFSQQDRIGNIDYVVEWVWVDAGKVQRKAAETHGKEDPPHPDAIRIKRTHLNDNDAGARMEYANYAKSTQMMEKMRHFPP